MKKAMSIIALFVVFIISLSAHTGKVIDASVGYTAPFITLDDSSGTVTLADYKGKYVLLTFWASNDAVSRIACREYAEFMSDMEDENICHLAINFDRSERLFEELVHNDGLDAKTQYYAQGEIASRIKSDYRLENGFETYLIDPKGMIIAKNPSKMCLTQIQNH